MKQTNTPPSKLRVVLRWLLVFAFVGGLMTFGFFMVRRQTPGAFEDTSFGRSAFFFAFGAIFLLAGIAAYFLFTFTNGFTTDFTRPIWNAMKVKIYLANVVVPLFLALGLGFMLSALVSPPLASAGLDPAMANLVPLFGVIGLLQVVQFVVLIWTPLEKRIVRARLAAQGITDEQLKGSVLAGLSNPASGYTKRFCMIEEDMGALWITPDWIVYHGDGEQFKITRDQLVEMERKADRKSTTMLAGIAHVILHVKSPGGFDRQIRLHVEGLWTLGQKRKAMDALAEAIAHWHAHSPAPPLPSAATQS